MKLFNSLKKLLETKSFECFYNKLLQNHCFKSTTPMTHSSGREKMLGDQFAK